VDTFAAATGYAASVSDRPILAVAHRAGNSLAELRAALDAGVDLVEADVHLFRDVLEVRHRKAIGRHLYWERWCEVNWRRNLALPELADVLAAADGDPRLMLDLKGPTLGVAPQVAALLRRAAPGVPVTVCTKQWRMLDAFAGDTHVRRVFSASDWLQLARLRARLRRCPAFGVSIRRQLLTPRVVAELRRRAEVVMVWPVDTEAALAHALRLGVTGVISKNLALLRRLVAAR
jgi:glycerophosphoryl diester phosphodiesterase